MENLGEADNGAQAAPLVLLADTGNLRQTSAEEGRQVLKPLPDLIHAQIGCLLHRHSKGSLRSYNSSGFDSLWSSVFPALPSRNSAFPNSQSQPVGHSKLHTFVGAGCLIYCDQ